MPLHKRLLTNDFYAKLDEHTEDLPAQTISKSSRIKNPTRNGRSKLLVVNYDESDSSLREVNDPLFGFMVEASIESRKAIGKRIRQAAKEHCQLNRKLGKRYLKKEVKRTILRPGCGIN